MRQAALVGLSLLTVAACIPQPQPSPQAGAGTEPIPTSYASGSPSNTTTTFDGTYAGVATQNISKGNTLDVAGGEKPITYQEYGVPPPLTIRNGLGQFQLLNYTFQGYVTPQGHLKLSAWLWPNG
jgi:hypothetical protein